jgi:glycosyltransferase involved in cell wall biosynthesis
MDPQTRPRLVTTVHGFNSVNAYSKIMTRGEAVICVSESIRKFVIEHYPDVPGEKLVVVHRGIDPKEYHPAFKPSQEWQENWSAEFPETRGKKLLTLPGRITRLKGHEDFLHVLASIKDQGYHGIIAGGAALKKQDYLDEVTRKVAEMGLQPFVTFTGHRSDLKEILAISSIVFSLTQQPESFGRTTLEALSLGVPVIGYQHGGVGEVLDALFPVGKVQPGNRRSIIHLINEWATSGSAPAPSLESPFTLQGMLEATLQTYIQLVQTGQVQGASTS